MDNIICFNFNKTTSMKHFRHAQSEVRIHSSCLRDIVRLKRSPELLALEALLLTHISIASSLLDISKLCKTRPDAQNAAPDQVLHCLLTEVTFKI